VESSRLRTLAGVLLGLLGLGICASAAILHKDLPLPRIPFLIGVLFLAWGVQLATGLNLFKEQSKDDRIVSACFTGGAGILALSLIPLFLSLTRPEFRLVCGLTFLGTVLVGAGILALGWRVKRGKLEKARGDSRN
jgi:FtsH-binding integral membrane protein